MAVIEAILAIVGLAMLVLLAIAALGQEPTEPPGVDVVAPYREGLQAAARLQAAEHELEQRLYAEAVRSASHELLSEQAPGSS